MWKRIVNTNYEVNKFGQIRNIKTGKILKPIDSWNGYKRVTLALGKRKVKKGFQIHRLVAEYFLENPENKPEVNHKDANKANNIVENLEWVTKEENIKHAVENNLLVTFRGEDHGCAKLNENQVMYIRNSNESAKLLSEEFQVHVRTIHRIKSRKLWKHLP